MGMSEAQNAKKISTAFIGHSDFIPYRLTSLIRTLSTAVTKKFELC